MGDLAKPSRKTSCTRTWQSSTPLPRNSAVLADTANKRAIREIVREAFERLGGADFLVTFATANHENARVFVSLVGRLIPTELVGKGGGPLTVVIKREDGVEAVMGQIIDQAPDTPRLQ